MENLTRGRVDEFNLASRRAEEADYLVGPLGIPSQPSEKEFISCLRNGLILCKIINKIQPGSVSKVIENNSATQSLLWDSQPLPAYQYFENVRNFLAAVEELKLPVFEASIFERDNLEEGSSTKVVDCILALKAYSEWKQMTGGNGTYKPPRSPLGVHSASRIQVRTPVTVTYDCSRKLDMSGGNNKPMPSMTEIKRLEDTIVKALADSKENMDTNLFASYRSGNVDSVKFFRKILSNCLEEQLQKTFPEMKSTILDHLQERSCSPVKTAYVPLADFSNLQNHKCCRACLEKGNCNHWNLVENQEKELLNIRQLLSSAKNEFESLQSQFQSDLKQLGDQLLEMSNAALGYHKVVKENRNLYNIVQDLKGNIRVYCRIRPPLNTSVQNIIDFIGSDGSLVVIDPLKPQKDGKKLFQFNRVFGPTSTQDEVFRDTQPLIRSVMDGYNVCIFAYGQTGSGKTHTMSGPPCGSANEFGICYLAINDLFELSAQRKDIIKYEIKVQMVEIYNEQVRDLLTEDSASSKYPFTFRHSAFFKLLLLLIWLKKTSSLTMDTLEIRSCVSDDSLVLPDATLRKVKSTIDVINLMKLGEVNRALGSTAINIRSSRSHSVLTVHVQGEDVTGGNILRSCLHLVDLAGSERVDKSEVSGDGLKEAQYINKSLSCLGDVITSLAQKNSHIPYRNSKLTLLLQNSLGGNAKTLMFAHVSPEGDSFGETMGTLKFAQRVSTVELGAARANKESTEVLELKAQIESLKRALAYKEVQTPQTKSLKESAKTPVGKPKLMTDKTPPRPRRLSIENGTTMQMDRSINYDNKRVAKSPVEKPKQMTEKTPPRPRRLSMENGNYDHKSVAKSPVEKPKQMTEKTPPQPRRLSIENGNYNHKSVVKSPVEKPKQMTEKTPPRPRRLSIENGTTINYDNKRVAKTPVKTPSRILSLEGTQTQKVSLQHQMAAPKSPISSAMKSPIIRIDTAIKVPSFQVPKTPEPQIKSTNEIQKVQLPNERPTQGKASQIRKSLRTIGKLINGSEKRSQQKQIEALTPYNGTIHEPKSPVSSNARALRRQSLTGIVPEGSIRSSVGEVSTDSCG
ncbi:hypothetical protein RD792_008090 [Penstemon davidsonii]|uniref:Uncharacterized protein n=1 Tax=Penstemon davidsonii TaxID=160366 RepID=A0ABR0D857_9LAMI|nr:hypothetical protein RD792_008090 [Penstemon davidsonii]